MELWLLAKVPVIPGAVASVEVLQGPLQEAAEDSPQHLPLQEMQPSQGLSDGQDAYWSTWERNMEAFMQWHRKFLMEQEVSQPRYLLLPFLVHTRTLQTNLWSQPNEQWRAACTGRAPGSLCYSSCPGFQHREELWDQ